MDERETKPHDVSGKTDESLPQPAVSYTILDSVSGEKVLVTDWITPAHTYRRINRLRGFRETRGKEFFSSSLRSGLFLRLVRRALAHDGGLEAAA